MITPWIINALVTAGLVKTGEAIGNAMSGGDNNSNEQPKFETIDGPSNSGNNGSSTEGSNNKEGETSGSNSANNTSSSNNSSNSNSSSSASSSTSVSAPSITTPETSDIAEVYEVLAPMAGNYMNAQAEQIGQAQRSMGTLAGRAMGSSRTAGLGNYTYNRLMRPQADAMRDELLVKGYATQLNQLLSNALNNAKSRYNKNSTGDNTDDSNASGVTKISGSGTKVKSKGTTMHALPNSYEFEDANGQWHRVNRTNESDDEWIRLYEGAKKKAAEEGRGFNG